MRPNVLMFHDTDENVLNAINIKRERYQTWERLVEEQVVGNGQKLVILELGCGVNVTDVREESVNVLLDSAKKVKANGTNEGPCALLESTPKMQRLTSVSIHLNRFQSRPRRQRLFRPSIPGSLCFLDTLSSDVILSDDFRTMRNVMHLWSQGTARLILAQCLHTTKTPYEGWICCSR